MAAPNWANQTIWTADNLDVLRGMNSASVDLVYLDPPFNSNRDYAAPIGSEAAGAAFKDTWTLEDVDLVWHGEIAEEEPALYGILNAAGVAHSQEMKAYLIMMAIRLLEMRRVLREGGSIYLHCDDTAGAYLKVLMDAVFGKANFKNEITWKRARGKGLNPTRYVRNSDRILFYAKGRRHTWNQQYEPFEEGYGAGWQSDEFGPFAPGDLTGGKAGGPAAYLPLKGVLPAPGRAWAPPVRAKFPPEARSRLPENYEELDALEKCEALDDAGLLYWPKKQGGKPRYKKYLSTLKGRYASDVIADIPPVQAHANERTHYPTQKPLPLLHRIIRASSKVGDVVLDPFCGCATACVAAEQLQRQWVGIDIAPKAADLVMTRLREEVGMFWQGVHREDIPIRTDLGDIPPYNANENKRLLYGRQEGLCNGCLTLFPYRNLTIDHVLAQTKGGSHHIDNLQLLCGACNSMKGTGTQEMLIAKLQSAGLRPTGMTG